MQLLVLGQEQVRVWVQVLGQVPGQERQLALHQALVLKLGRVLVQI